MRDEQCDEYCGLSWVTNVPDIWFEEFTFFGYGLDEED